MDTTRFIDTKKGIVYTTVTGELTLKEVRADMENLTADPSYRPTMPGLVDLRGVTKLLTTDEITQLAETIRSSPRVVAHTHRALLVGSDLSFGMYRMFEALSTGGSVEYRVFRDEAEARAWVEEAAAAAAGRQ
jgi:SpoIIAA-like